ncbi:MAG: UDP-N-acetylglucosamine 1-carboxyvinyltransferase, partial [Proteobacteria bacterium]|nr:UDP-N-acetylglucosamine 1-carboxyvinyltransferase [Pseudomonadota bacterium]
KNSALPIMTASLLTDQPCTLRGVPDLRDIKTMGRLLGILGVKQKPAQGPPDGNLTLQTSATDLCEAPYDLVKTMRASILVLGPLLARHHRARVSLPGGCAIGARPIDIHLAGLEKMGARISLVKGYVEARCRRLRGVDFTCDKVTVTGTENLLMAATLAKGTTVIRNAAREPEVVDLGRMLVQMGARIDGLGTDAIVVEGVDALQPAQYRVMPDRIEAGTLMVAAGITGGRVTINHCPTFALGSVMDKLAQTGLRFEVNESSVTVTGPDRPIAADLVTMPYPGFATDMQAQFMALMTLAEGTSVIKETIFENRFMHVSELRRMGAEVGVDGGQAVVTGVKRLLGAPVMATDLRASASLVLAGLAAKNTTEINRVYHLDRGYERIDRKLRRLGARIRRVKQ